jgi:hypothetical protein
MPSRFDGLAELHWREKAMNRWIVARAAFAVILSCLAGLPRAADAQSVTTYHNSLNRTGAYTVPGLTFAAAKKLHRVAGFNPTISGDVYAQPLYWEQGSGKPPLLIVATESNLVYALNANSGAAVWKTQLAPSVPGGTLPCGNISPEGITGTPVIDPAAGRLYLDASTIQGGSLPRHMIYALSLATGKIVAHWPLNVDNAMAARHASFTSELQGERSALQFFKGKLYITYAGRAGDCGSSNGAVYRGVVIEVTPSATPEITGDWETRAARGGIWAQGGASSDGISLFVTTGNTSGASHWGDGEAVLRLAPGLAHSFATKNYFTPAGWQTLDNDDADLGGTAAIPIRVRDGSGYVRRIIGFGKDGHAYLLNGANLGGIGHAIASPKVSNTRIITGPAIHQTATGTLVIFAGYAGLNENCSGTDLTMVKVTAAKAPLSIGWCVPINGSGAPIVTTTDGTQNAIVWAAGAEGDNELHGFNAVTGATVFSGAGTSMNGLHHFSTLIAANHRLYVAGDNALYAFAF